VNRVRRERPQLVDRAGKDDSPAVDDRQVGAEFLDFGHVVAAEDDGSALVRQTPGDGAHVARAGRVEGARRFVEDQQPGRTQQRRGEAETLTHARRVACHGDVCARGETDLFEDVVDPFAAAGSAIAVETGEQRDVPSSGQVRIEGRSLHEPGNSVRHRSDRRIQIAAEHAHGTGVRPDESE
jgi:hypothetical protein